MSSNQLIIHHIKNLILKEYKTNYSSRYSDDKYAIQLINSIDKSNSFEDLINSFKHHSKAVFNRETAFDYLNGCDGDNSILSLFIHWLILPQNISFYTSFLDSISSSKDYDENEWIINELNFLLWTNPIDCSNAIEYFIKHPIIGPHFSFWGGCWITNDYYTFTKRLSLEKIDDMYIHYFNLYKQLYENQPGSRF
jgi:hypothetical protein